VGGQEWNEAVFASTAETEAAAQALFSMGDILAQIVNKSVLKEPLPEAQVSLPEVHKHLEEQGYAPIVVAQIESLQKSNEFKYLSAFVNTIKHRHLLDINFRAERGEGTRNTQGIRFKDFEYKGRNYPVTWATDILNSYKKRIAVLICAVGNAINDYLRSQG